MDRIENEDLEVWRCPKIMGGDVVWKVARHKGTNCHCPMPDRCVRAEGATLEEALYNLPVPK